MRKGWVPLFAAVMLLSSGCYWNETVLPNQVAVQLSGGRIGGVVGEGLYTDLGWFSTLEQMSRDPIDFEINDPQTATKEKQLVGIKLNVKMQRPGSGQPDRVAALWRDFNNLARGNEAIPLIMDGPTRQAIKVNVATFTLDELLADRNRLRELIFAELDARAGQYNLDVLSVDVADVLLEQRYAEELQKRQLVAQARITAEQEKLLIEQQTNNERFKAEQDKQTRLAEAARDREVANVQAQREREVALIEADRQKQVALIEADRQKQVALIEAERKKQVAVLDAEARRTGADAEAYSVQKVASTLTPEFVEWQQVQRWDGKLPTAIYGQSPIPFLPVPNPGQPPATTSSGQ